MWKKTAFNKTLTIENIKLAVLSLQKTINNENRKHISD